jgi:hypothetical protein
MQESNPGEYSLKRIDHQRWPKAIAEPFDGPSEGQNNSAAAPLIVCDYAQDHDDEVVLNQKNFLHEYSGHQCSRTFSTKLPPNNDSSMTCTT